MLVHEPFPLSKCSHERAIHPPRAQLSTTYHPLCLNQCPQQQLLCLMFAIESMIITSAIAAPVSACVPCNQWSSSVIAVKYWVTFMCPVDRIMACGLWPVWSCMSTYRNRVRSLWAVIAFSSTTNAKIDCRCDNQLSVNGSLWNGLSSKK